MGPGGVPHVHEKNFTVNQNSITIFTQCKKVSMNAGAGAKLKI